MIFHGYVSLPEGSCFSYPRHVPMWNHRQKRIRLATRHRTFPWFRIRDASSTTNRLRQPLSGNSRTFLNHAKIVVELQEVQGSQRLQCLKMTCPTNAFDHSMLVERYNARFYHAYLDKDCMGSMKGIARRVHRKLLEMRVLMRWLLGLKYYLRH